MLDMKTIMLSYVVSNSLIAVFVALLWHQNRKRYAGLGFWLIDYVLQVVGLGLNSVRDVMPEFVFILLANTLIISGMLILYMGLERFVGKPRPQIHNYLLLVAFVGFLAYFTYVHADISIRTGIISAAILLLAVQSSDLMLRRAGARLRPITRYVGIVFIGYALVGLARIVFLVLHPLAPLGNWFQAPQEQTLAMLIFQILALALTFALILMVTRRLLLDGQVQDAERQRAQVAQRESEEYYRLLANFTSDWIYWRDQEGKIAYISPSCEKITEYRPQEFIEDSGLLEKIVHTDDVDFIKHLRDLSPTDDLISLDYRIITRGGEIRWLNHVCRAVYGESGEYRGRCASNRDITERKQADETLGLMNERLSLATRAGSLGIWDWDMQKNQLVWDDRMYELYGLKKVDFLGAYEAWLKGIHPDDRAQSDEISRQAQRGEREYDTEFRVVWPDGTIRYLKAYGQFVRDSSGNPIRMTGINYDITESKRAEAEIEQLAKFPSENPNPVLRIGREGIILYANNASGPLLNKWRCQVGQSLPTRWRKLVLNALGTGENQIANAQTQGRVFSLTFSPILKAGYVNVYGLDITERKQAEEALLRAHESVEATNRELAQALEREKLLARTDGLTGAYNRRQFFELAAHEFAVAKRYKRPLTMIVFDIDYLKKANDTFGHQVGDALIKCTAQRAREQLREADTLARYGGDEFAILLPASNAREAAIVSERIRENVAACQIDTGGYKAGVTISLGISEYPETGSMLDQLFQQADQAMYTAKEAGRNRIRIYSPEN
jgi:diguanylate cyclase (GGDEF)-like protein/PAS domain S-box-containing protein